MIVISDTTAISSLHKINELDILRKIFGEVVVPKEVMEELMFFENQYKGFKWSETYPWLKVVALQEAQTKRELRDRLDEGESAAIALSLELDADLLLIDEKLGRILAVEYGLDIIGLIGVIELAKKRGYITSVKLLIDELISFANFRISKELYERVLKIADE